MSVEDHASHAINSQPALMNLVHINVVVTKDLVVMEFIHAKVIFN